jgi:hypothetical protein
MARRLEARHCIGERLAIGLATKPTPTPIMFGMRTHRQIEARRGVNPPSPPTMHVLNEEVLFLCREGVAAWLPALLTPLFKGAGAAP